MNINSRLKNRDTQLVYATHTNSIWINMIIKLGTQLEKFRNSCFLRGRFDLNAPMKNELGRHIVMTRRQIIIHNTRQINVAEHPGTTYPVCSVIVGCKCSVNFFAYTKISNKQTYKNVQTEKKK